METKKTETVQEMADNNSFTSLFFKMFCWLGLFALIITGAVWILSPVMSLLPATFWLVFAGVYFGNKFSGKSE